MKMKLSSLLKGGTDDVCKKRMVKSRTGDWVVKALTFVTVVGGVVLATGETVDAAEWTANSSSEIAQRLSSDKSYTFIKGDTFYEIGIATNIKFDKLMELNGFAMGEQYTVPVGTTISFDGANVEIKDINGEVKHTETLTDKDKIDTTQTFAGQVSDTPKGDITVNKSTVHSGTSNNVTERPKNPEFDKPVKPVKPGVETPVVPNPNKPGTDKPVKPTDPGIDKPIKPEEKPGRPGINEDMTLEEARAKLAEIQAEMADVQAELANVDIEIAAIDEAATANADEILSKQNDIANLDAEIQSSQSQILENDNKIADLKAQLEDEDADKDVIQMQIDILEIANTNLSTGIAEASIAKETAQAELNDLQGKTFDKSALEAKKQELNVLLATLEKEEAIVQGIIDRILEEQAAIEALEAARSNALAEIEGLNLKDDKSTYIAYIKEAGTINAINDLVAQAHKASAINDENDAKEQAAKELADAKADGHKQLAELNLKDDAVKFATQIDKAQSVNEIESIVNEAKTVSAENDKIDAEAAELEQAKSQAKTIINALNDLSDAEKVQFGKQVDAATNASEIDNVVKDAQEQNEINAKDKEAAEAAEKLAKAKEAAMSQLGKLNLSKEEAADYHNQISDAKDESSINAIMNEAKKVSEANDIRDKEEAAQKELDEHIEKALAQLDKLNLKDDKTKFTEGIKSAKTKSDVDAVLAKAKQVSEANDKADAEKEKVQGYKDQARKELAALGFSNEDIEKYFGARIESIKSESDIAPIVKDAKEFKAIDSQRKQLIKNMQAAPFVDQATKDKFIERAEKATTFKELDAIGDDFTKAYDAARSADIEKNSIKTFEKLLNDERVKQGKPALIYDASHEGIQEGSHTRAEEIMEVFNHKRPDGSSYESAFKNDGKNRYVVVSENIVRFNAHMDATAEEIAEEALKQWMASPGHHAILMDERKGDLYFTYSVKMSADGSQAYAVFNAYQLRPAR
ncbi:hypothetical protein [Vagococcus lutrae]|uniref:hypothetical protein n=1 Tax=Vagococcus lutrae TaxID=81947 RepID=UPI00200E8767|nr:hypothetical protein [Vagococcus lutrae]MDT2806415.1 hypothetical protein [Vagococcus lutrae]MDT2823534.1 hypothetical protein [Vagococcus lutrae]UQF18429.1 hypothetical protein M2905_07240 [Vagococcus lutrae]